MQIAILDLKESEAKSAADEIALEFASGKMFFRSFRGGCVGVKPDIQSTHPTI